MMNPPYARSQRCSYCWGTVAADRDFISGEIRSKVKDPIQCPTCKTPMGVRETAKGEWQFYLKEDPT